MHTQTFYLFLFSFNWIDLISIFSNFRRIIIDIIGKVVPVRNSNGFRINYFMSRIIIKSFVINRWKIYFYCKKCSYHLRFSTNLYYWIMLENIKNIKLNSSESSSSIAFPFIFLSSYIRWRFDSVMLMILLWYLTVKTKRKCT